jgi:hypothetical protein
MVCCYPHSSGMRIARSHLIECLRGMRVAK